MGIYWSAKHSVASRCYCIVPRRVGRGHGGGTASDKTQAWRFVTHSLVAKPFPWDSLWAIARLLFFFLVVCFPCRSGGASTGIKRCAPNSHSDAPMSSRRPDDGGPNGPLDKWLRVTTLMSCSSGPSCKLCDDASLSAAMRTACYAAGCSCFGATVYSQGDCTGASKAAKHASYSCPLMHMPIIAPSGSLVSMTVYDFDTGPASNVVETLHVPDYEYYKTPLRATSDASIASSIAVNETARTFTATASGSSADNPTDPTRLSESQAS